MLMPKRVKFRRMQRGRMTGKATRGNTVSYGEYGLMALEPGWVKSNQIEAARIAMTRYITDIGNISKAGKYSFSIHITESAFYFVFAVQVFFYCRILLTQFCEMLNLRCDLEQCIFVFFLHAHHPFFVNIFVFQSTIVFFCNKFIVFYHLYDVRNHNAITPE